ncbi:MAG: protein kinase [Deltaproteobacteria bacterium]|nr:protein kinase [Deltaproteobacteria bacterium]
MSDPHLAQARERLGHVLKDRWVLEDVLGVGGMAAVYAARHRNGARAAIKLLHGPLSEDQVVRERFLREAYLANSLEHGGTVHVLDDDADPKLGPFLVMELLDGQSLLELLDAGVAFDVHAVLDIANQALDVLAAAHERRVVHRDLKPANLFLCRNGHVKVLDFGIARVLDETQARLTRTGVPLGTPAYMAPEQARGLGREADGRADLYALGATLFRLLAGRHVHVGRGAEQIAKVATMRAPKLKDVAPQVPPMVAAVIDRSLEFEPERRYTTARDMQSDVRALLQGQIPPIASRPLPEPGPVPSLPAIAPKRRGTGSQQVPDNRRDDVSAIAESLRQRAKEAARRPDAFTVALEEGTTEEREEDENMPTLVGSPREMIVGSRPTPLSEATPPARRPARVPAPRRHPMAQPPPSARNTADAATGIWGTAAAQAFARVPNVPVPQPPSSHSHVASYGASSPSPQSRPLIAAPPPVRIEERFGQIDEVDDGAPTIARGDAKALLAQLAQAKAAAPGAQPPPVAANPGGRPGGMFGPPSDEPPSSQRGPLSRTQMKMSVPQFSPPSIPPVPYVERTLEPSADVVPRQQPLDAPPLTPQVEPPQGMNRGALIVLLALLVILVPLIVALIFKVAK